MAATVLIMFKLHLPKGLAYAQTIAFLSLIVIQWANAFNMNFEHRSWVHNFTKPNWKLIAAIFGSMVVNVILFCTPLRQYFSLASLEVGDTLKAIIIPVLIAFVCCDLHKLATWKLRSWQSYNAR
jgi:magnesium-transporting ATPase (P-type)